MNRMSRLAVQGFNGDALLRLRHAAGMTQEDLAIHIGVSTTSVSSWELGRSAPDPTNFAELKRIFAHAAEELLDAVDPLRGLAQHRTRAGYSQDQAAKAAGLSVGAVRLIERGVRLPTDDERAALAAAYGITEAEVNRLSENLHHHRKGRPTS